MRPRKINILEMAWITISEKFIAVFPEIRLSFKPGLETERKKYRKFIHILIFQTD